MKTLMIDDCVRWATSDAKHAKYTTPQIVEKIRVLDGVPQAKLYNIPFYINVDELEPGLTPRKKKAPTVEDFTTDQEFINRITELTQNNDHTLARLEIAKKTKQQDLIEVLETIFDANIDMGNIDDDVQFRVNFAHIEVADWIEDNLGEEARERVEKCL